MLKILTKCLHVPILFFFPCQQKSVLYNFRGQADLRLGNGHDIYKPQVLSL
jgi:hypothetical protein